MPQMMTETMTTAGEGTVTHRLLSHYDKVKDRLHNPLNMPVKNHLHAVLSAAAERKRAEQLAKKLERLEKRELAIIRRNRERGRIRAAKTLKARHAKIPALVDIDYSRPMAKCPFKRKDSPKLYAAMETIVKHFHVTWPLIASVIRTANVFAARTVVITVLKDAGFGAYTIAKLLGKDQKSVYVLLKRHAASARNNACFTDAMTCLKDISASEYGAWKTTCLPSRKNQETDQNGNEDEADEIHSRAGQAVLPEAVRPE